MFPLFPLVGPIIEGFTIIWEGIVGAFSGLVSKNVAQTIWNVLKFIFVLVFVIILSFLKAMTVDFFKNIVKYWKKPKSNALIK